MSDTKKLANLSETSAAYYERMSYVLSNAEDIEPSSRDDLVQNFIQQVTNDNLVTVSLSLSASRVLERFITGWCTQGSMLTLLRDVNRENVLLLATDKNGSHVLESMLNKISNFLYKVPVSDVSNLVDYFGTEFAPCCIEHCIELAFDSYGTHILRVLVQIVCGVIQTTVNHKDGIVVKKTEYTLYTPPQEFSQLPESILSQFKDYPNLLKAATDTYASPAIKSVIEILKLSHPELSKQLNKYLIKYISPLHQLVDHEKGSYLVQALISTADKKQYARIFNQFIPGSIYKYAISKHANYAVQTLIAKIHTEEQFVCLLQELNSKTIESILGQGNFGVLHQIVKSGLEHPTLQPEIKSLLLETFQCQHKPLGLIPLLLLMSPYNDAMDNAMGGKVVLLPKDRLHLHGSLITQCLFSYEKPKLFVKGLLSNSIEGILKIASDPNGCHVLDKFVCSEKIKQKYKNNLYSMIQGEIVDFVSCKYGSRVFDCIWKELDYGWKERFINEISQKESDLKSDFYGKFVCKNCKLDFYKRRKSEWQKSIQTTPDSREGMKRGNEEPIPLAKRRRSGSRRISEKTEDNIDIIFSKLH